MPDDLTRLGLYLQQVTRQLADEGVEKFDKSAGQLIVNLRKRRDAIAGP